MQFIIQNNLPEKVRQLGQYFMTGLERMKERFDFVIEVRGIGLLVAMVFNSDISSELVQSCLKEGLLVNAVKPNALRFMPPLIVTKEDINKSLEILEKIFNRG